tara:strand:- start:67407 stop:67532 length:126 start_codon:yes stop_codon:yes gene_type:complete
MEILLILAIVASFFIIPSSLETRPLEHQSVFLSGEKFDAKL